MSSTTDRRKHTLPCVAGLIAQLCRYTGIATRLPYHQRGLGNISLDVNTSFMTVSAGDEAGPARVDCRGWRREQRYVLVLIMKYVLIHVLFVSLFVVESRSEVMFVPMIVKLHMPFLERYQFVQRSPVGDLEKQKSKAVNVVYHLGSSGS